MPLITRQAALEALTDSDTFSICLALGTEIDFLKESVARGINVEFWQLKLDAAELARDRIYAIRVAS